MTLEEIIEMKGVCPYCEFEHIKEEDFMRLYYDDELEEVFGNCGQCGREWVLYDLDKERY